MIKKLNYGNKLPAYLIAIFFIAISFFTYQRQQIKITKITDLSRIQLPADIRRQLAPDHYSELMYIHKQDKVIQYYFNGINSGRCLLLLQKVKALAVSLGSGIPNGGYLLTLHDEAYHSYSWPVLAFAATQPQIAAKEVVLMPDPDAMRGYGMLMQRINRGMQKYSWNKKQSKIFWRGSASGATTDTHDINGSKRLRFLNAARSLEFVDAAFTDYGYVLSESFKQKLAALPHLRLMSSVQPQDSLAYKYLMDVDGYSCSYSRMAWILYSNSVLMKHTSDKIQWYYHLLKPYVNYIPIKEDFSDLQQQFEWAETHPKAVQKMAKNARNLAKRVFSEYQIKIAMKQAFRDYHAVVSKLPLTVTAASPG